jgi:hypothetical protein
LVNKRKDLATIVAVKNTMEEVAEFIKDITLGKGDHLDIYAMKKLENPPYEKGEEGETSWLKI